MYCTYTCKHIHIQTHLCTHIYTHHIKIMTQKHVFKMFYFHSSFLHALSTRIIISSQKGFQPTWFRTWRWFYCQKTRREALCVLGLSFWSLSHLSWVLISTSLWLYSVLGFLIEMYHFQKLWPSYLRSCLSLPRRMGCLSPTEVGKMVPMCRSDTFCPSLQLETWTAGVD